jgi:hypothetical protein
LIGTRVGVVLDETGVAALGVGEPAAGVGTDDGVPTG